MKISDSAERKLNCGKMPKPRCKAYLKSALGEIVSLRIAMNILHPKIRESRPVRQVIERAGQSAPKVIRRPAPSSERAGTGKGGNYYNGTPMRSFKVSGATAAQRSYYLARLKCGLVKGKYVG